MIQSLRTPLFALIFLFIGLSDCFAQPATPGAITGVTPVCQGVTGRVYSVVAVPTATSYTWTYTGSGATITSGSTTRSITVTYSATSTSGDWSVTATNGGGTSSASAPFAVTVNTTPARPGAYTTSSALVCQNQSGVSYAVAAVSGATSYNWTYSGTGATFSGSTNSETVDYSASATSGTLSIAATNGTCTSAVRSLAISVGTAIPATPGAITGTSPVCQRATGRTYSVVAVSGATSYTWSYTGTGASITSGSTTRSITVTYSATATSGDWSVVANNGCGTSAASAAYSVVVNTTPAQPGAYTTSSTTACQGQTGKIYTINAVSGASSYIWNYTGTGATFSGTNSTTESVDFSGSATSGNITVAASTGTCTSPVRSVAVTVGGSLPTTPGAITGTSPVCQRATGTTYSVVAVSGATSYTWSYTGTGATITAGSTTRSITVTYSASATSGDWSVMANNGCGSSAPSTAYSVVVNTTPAQPGAYTTSSTTACQGETGKIYTINAVSGATTYIWNYTGTGATFSGTLSTTESVDFSGSATSGSITVAAGTATCTSPVRSVAVTVGGSIPATPGSITGTSPVCQRATGTTYSVVAVSGATSYTWSYTGTGATITAGSTTRSITVTYSASATSGDWSVMANNGCGSSAPSTAYSVVVNTTPAQPGAYTTSSSTACQGQTGKIYTIAAVSGATTYIWNYTGTGATFSGTNSNTESVDFSGSATSGSITVAAGTATCTSPVRSVAVTVGGSMPAIPGSITGSASICKPISGRTYSVVAVSGATSYTWSYTGTGASITAGSTTRSITVSYSASATSGDWSVVANNGCGSSASSSPLSIAVSSTPAQPGAFSASSTTVCQNQTGVVYTVPAVAGATSYVWNYTGTGATFSGITNSVTADFSGSATSGNVTVAATNGACIGTVRSVAVTVNAAPLAPGIITGVTPVDQNTTGHIYTVDAVSGATSYTWMYSGTGATITAGNNTNSITVSYSVTATAGDWTATATNVCGTSPSSPAYAVAIRDQRIFRSISTGNFSSISTWESSSDSIVWFGATIIPSSTTSTVTIDIPHNVTMDVAATIKNIIINGTLNANSSNTLTINGYFTNNGSFVHNNGTIEFSGDNAYSISGSSITDFYNLLINKTSDATVTVESNVSLKEKLSFGTNATNELLIDNGAGGSFTFLSDATSTAHVGVNTSPLPLLTGNFICQRYFPAQSGRYAFMLGVPVTNTYMSDLQPTQFDGSGAPTDGIFVSGPFTGADTGRGLSTTASSSFAYNPNTGLYSSYPVSGGNVATTPLVIGNAYRESVRDGGPGAEYPTVVAKTLSVTGALVAPGSFTYSGLVNVPGTKPFASGTFAGITTGGWNLIANPFMSDISIDLSDAAAWSNTNISHSSYIYDAASRDFQVCASGVGNCTIPAFQGFWIQATGAPALTIHEQAKVSTTNNATILRVAQDKQVLNFINIKLVPKIVTSAVPATIRYVDSSSFENDRFDGYKLGVTNRSCNSGAKACLYTKAINGVFYAVNSKPYGLLSDTTEMNAIAPIGDASLDFSDIRNLEPNKYRITLIDKFANTNTDVSSNPVYQFTVTSDTNSWGPRFRVVFTDISNITTDFAAEKLTSGSWAGIYTSPTSAEKVTVYANEITGDAEFLIYDLTGRLVFNSKLNLIDKKAFQVFDLSRILQSGIYSTVIKSNNSNYSQKLIIR